MKKLFTFAALLALASCTTSPSIIDLDEGERATPTANVCLVFDDEDNGALLYNIATEVYQMHIHFDQFKEMLPENLANLGEGASLDALIEAIHIWWMDDNCWEVLIEWTVFDKFIELIEETKYQKLFEYEY